QWLEHVTHQPHVMIKRQPGDSCFSFDAPELLCYRRQIAQNVAMTDGDTSRRHRGTGGELDEGKICGERYRPPPARGQIIELVRAKDLNTHLLNPFLWHSTEPTGCSE